jgi:hypothetical protein
MKFFPSPGWHRALNAFDLQKWRGYPADITWVLMEAKDLWNRCAKQNTAMKGGKSGHYPQK